MSKTLVVLASGSGTTFKYLVESSRNGKLAAQISQLVVDRSKCGAVSLAEELKVPYQTVAPRDFSNVSLWDEQLTSVVKKGQSKFNRSSWVFASTRTSIFETIFGEDYQLSSEFTS